MSDERPPPDLAMYRAVEILASLYERTQSTPEPPPPSDRPIVLFNEAIALDVNRTTRLDVQSALGIGFAYPAAGWHTYCVSGIDGTREFLSIFFSDDRLASVELYRPKSARAPALAPRNLGGFRLIPGEITLGRPVTTLPAHFGHLSAAAEKLGAYANAHEAIFPGGVAYAMGNDGILERLALYVKRDA